MPMMKRRRSEQAAAAPFEWVSSSAEQTQRFGEQLGRLLHPGDVVAFHGDLGSGKTTLIQGIARGLGRDSSQVKSPTFVIMREYSGNVPLVHIDGYRLEGPSSAAWLDLDLIFSPSKVTLIEWAERLQGLLPEERFEVRLSHVSTNRRRVQVTPVGIRAGKLLGQLKDAVSAAPSRG